MSEICTGISIKTIMLEGYLLFTTEDWQEGISPLNTLGGTEKRFMVQVINEVTLTGLFRKSDLRQVEKNGVFPNGEITVPVQEDIISNQTRRTEIDILVVMLSGLQEGALVLIIKNLRESIYINSVVYVSCSRKLGKSIVQKVISIYS